MMDEIKLKNGIMWNCMNNEVTGFVGEDLKTNELLENILGLKDVRTTIHYRHFFALLLNHPLKMTVQK